MWNELQEHSYGNFVNAKKGQEDDTLCSGIFGKSLGICHMESVRPLTVPHIIQS